MRRRSGELFWSPFHKIKKTGVRDDRIWVFTLDAIDMDDRPPEEVSCGTSLKRGAPNSMREDVTYFLPRFNVSPDGGGGPLYP